MGSKVALETHQFLCEVYVGLSGLESNDAEHDYGGEYGGSRVGETHYERVSESIVVGLGVACEGNQSSSGHSQ